MLLGLATFGSVVGVLGFALSGCGTAEGVSPEASPQQTSAPAPTEQAPSSGPAQWPTDGSSPARLSGDGRYFGYVRAASADPLTISFDVVQFFYGKSVQKAAEEDGAVRPGEPVSNDHYERNSDEKISALKLAGDVGVTAGAPASFLMHYVSRKTAVQCEAEAARDGTMCTQIPLSLATFVAAIKGLDEKYGVPVWLTIRDGLVVRIDEQYFP